MEDRQREPRRERRFLPSESVIDAGLGCFGQDSIDKERNERQGGEDPRGAEQSAGNAHADRLYVFLIDGRRSLQPRSLS